MPQTKSAQVGVLTENSRRPLNSAQEQFAALIVEGLSQSAALRKSHKLAEQWKPQRVYEVASRWAANPQIRARILQLRQDIYRQVVFEQVGIVRQIHALATSDIRGIVNEKGQIRLPHELDAGTAAAVSKFKMTASGAFEYQFHSKVSALDQACKILGLYERDNRQKTDPLAELLKNLDGKVLGPTADTSPNDGEDERDPAEHITPNLPQRR